MKVDTPFELKKYPYGDWESSNAIIISDYMNLNYSHQSAAVYGDYAFFVTSGRTEMSLFNLKNKELLYTLKLKGANKTTYHCNQSSFGIERFEESDPFPILYISQHSKTDDRYMIEGYRILPSFRFEFSEYESFSIELVQTIYLPKMSYYNSLGNANCVIDDQNRFMYTYSRNNRTVDDNYGVCKISKFSIPPVNMEVVYLEDQDILDSYYIDCTAINMQGGCIRDNLLYIGQGLPSSGDVHFNVIDLRKKELIQRFALAEYKVKWEPEGCFYYDNCVMLAHTSAISRIDK